MKLWTLILVVVAGGVLMGCGSSGTVESKDVERWKNEGLPAGEKGQQQTNPSDDRPER